MLRDMVSSDARVTERVWGRNIIQLENECILIDGFNNKIISYSENVLIYFSVKS